MMQLLVRYLSHLQHLKSSKGYTIGEVTIVLLSWSILLICLVPVHHQVFQEVQTNHYINQFKDDLLFTQHLAIHDHTYYWLLIRPEAKEYVLLDQMNKETIIHRKFPKNWFIQMLTLDSTIRFNSNGTINSPGTMRLHSPNHTYKITFPFGTSRVRIDEQ